MDNTTLTTMTTPEELIQQMNYSSAFLAGSCMTRVGGMISVLSCLWVVYDNLIKKKDQLKNTGSIIVVMMSACDVLQGFSYYVLGSSMEPKGVAWGAIGNAATCEIQGFVNAVFILSSVTYNAMLALYFLLVVRHQWGPSRFETKCCRFWFLAFPLVWTILFAIFITLSGSMINPGLGWSGCYISAFPMGCNEFPEIMGECTVNFDLAQICLSLTVCVTILCSIIIIVSMVLLYQYIKTTQKRSAQYNTNNETAERRTLQAAKVGILYSGAFVLSWSVYIFAIPYALITDTFPQWMQIWMTVMLSLQGFFNAAVYAYRQK